jgi:pimeloyl-ACP methyl ester carboxylesterase
MRVYAPAFPGCGGSARFANAPNDLHAYAAFVDAFCAAVGLEEPVVFMGHSFGGGVAIQTACDFPHRVRGLVLINSIGGSTWRRDGSIVRSMTQRPLWDWGLHFSRDLLPPRQIRRVVPVILDTAVPNLLRNPRVFWQSAGVARHADLTPELEELKRRRLPVVVLWGKRDALVTRASFDALCEALGDPPVITVEGGHSWLLAEPDRFGEVITNVLPVVAAA